MEKVSALTWTALMRIATDVWQSAQRPPYVRRPEGPPKQTPEDIERALDIYRDLVLKNCDIAGISDLTGPQRFSAPRPAQRRLYIPREMKLLWGILKGVLSAPFMGMKAPHDEEEYIDRDAFDKWEASSIGGRIDLARRVIVWGEAGSGKTSLVQWLATGLTLRQRQDKEFGEFPGAEMLPEGDYLPIVARACELNHDDPETWVKGVMQRALDDEKKSVAFNDALMAGFKVAMDGGKALILIDGADELTNLANAEQFFLMLTAITRGFPKARILISSDCSAWRGVLNGTHFSFEHVAQTDISDGQKADFARNWCEIAVGEKRRADRIDELKKAVDATETIRRLTKNPMPLTMLAMVVAGPGGSPKSRMELYDESLRTLVYSPNIDSGVVDRSESFPQLQYLAFEMWRRDTHCLPEEEIIEMLEGFWREHPELRPIRDRTAEEFFRLAKRRTGILVEEKKVGAKDGGRLYGFRHRIYRDYLAGCALYEGFYEGCDRSKPVNERISEMTRKIRVFSHVPSDFEYDAAGKWVDVLRACVAMCDDSEVDEVLRAISESGKMVGPVPESELQKMCVRQELEYTGRPQAVLAALCLAQEERASDATAREIISAMLEYGSRYEYPPFMKSLYHQAATALWKSKWGGMLREQLLKRRAETEQGERRQYEHLYSQISAEIASEDEADSAKWLDKKKQSIRSGTNDEAVEAMLALPELIRQGRITSDTDLIESLFTLLDRGEDVAEHAASTLNFLVNIFGNKGPAWFPDEEDKERVLKIISDPARSARVVDKLMGIIYMTRYIKAFDVVLEKLNDDYFHIRSSACGILGELGDASAVEPLIKMLDDEDSLVRYRAARALGKLGDQRAVEPLRRKFDEADQTPDGSKKFRVPREKPVYMEALLKLTRDEIDQKLIARRFGLDEYSTIVFLTVPIDEDRVRRAAKKLGISEEEVKERYESLSEEFGIQLKWKPETLWPDNPFTGAPDPPSDN